MKPKIDLNELKRLHGQGLSDRKIAKIFKVHPKTIGYHRRKMGLPPVRVKKVNYEEFKRLRKEECLSTEDLARRFKISLAYAGELLRKFGLSEKRGQATKVKWQKIWEERKEKLVEIINKKGWIIPEEAREILKISKRSLSRMRYILHMLPEIKEIRFTGTGHPRRFTLFEMFGDFSKKRIWYIKESHPGFIAFVADLLPVNLSVNLRRAITWYLKNQGLSLRTIHEIYAKKGI